MIAALVTRVVAFARVRSVVLSAQVRRSWLRLWLSSHHRILVHLVGKWVHLRVAVLSGHWVQRIVDLALGRHLLAYRLAHVWISCPAIVSWRRSPCRRLVAIAAVVSLILLVLRLRLWFFARNGRRLLGRHFAEISKRVEQIPCQISVVLFLLHIVFIGEDGREAVEAEVQADLVDLVGQIAGRR